ncbi:hypothetical protein CBR_g51662 [Chara braunii]|uniref:Uncharacterized protein n=1 Tax=Chara braunii TaxID=69332 RepID=A0A388M8U4_CHABU|nr:hypothetical protein CBR_g51662 [Chara braunii]|eukprot:GBG91004.1 hypothetical protein CBR_g51662 [Chara braunii]
MGTPDNRDMQSHGQADWNDNTHRPATTEKVDSRKKAKKRGLDYDDGNADNADGSNDDEDCQHYQHSHHYSPHRHHPPDLRHGFSHQDCQDSHQHDTIIMMGMLMGMTMMMRMLMGMTMMMGMLMGMTMTMEYLTTKMGVTMTMMMMMMMMETVMVMT